MLCYPALVYILSMKCFRSKKLGNLWDEMIYPCMKKAIICALLSTQDLVEYRKVRENCWLIP